MENSECEVILECSLGLRRSTLATEKTHASMATSSTLILKSTMSEQQDEDLTPVTVLRLAAVRVQESASRLPSSSQGSRPVNLP
jgi:hypothetical protein